MRGSDALVLMGLLLLMLEVLECCESEELCGLWDDDDNDAV